MVDFLLSGVISGVNPCPKEVNRQFVTDFKAPNIYHGTLFTLVLSLFLYPLYLGREMVYHIFRPVELYKCDDSCIIIDSM